MAASNNKTYGMTLTCPPMVTDQFARLSENSLSVDPNTATRNRVASHKIMPTPHVYSHLRLY